MSNLLEAIVRIHNLKSLAIEDIYKSKIRANNMGEALENFISDAFADTFEITNEEQKIVKYSNTFSYTGSQNTPPDLIIDGGDAIEIKKVENMKATSIALNSSYPKNKLDADSHMISEKCKNCEKNGWKEKDIIYSVGVIIDKYLKSLCFIYGEDYAATSDIYERIKYAIKNGINEIQDIKFSETKEIGRINKIDPLKITNLRIRGMWEIKIPFKVFNYITKEQKYFAIINIKKYNSFPEKSRKLIENTKGIIITDHKIKDPNNPAKLKDVKLICFKEIL